MATQNILSVLLPALRRNLQKPRRNVEISQHVFTADRRLLRVRAVGIIGSSMNSISGSEPASNLPSASLSHFTFAVVMTASAFLVACAGQQDSRPTLNPVAPGTVEPSGSSNLGTGSYQGPVVNSAGEAQAILTLDVWKKDNHTNARLTLSPDGVTNAIALNEDDQSFTMDFPAFSSGPNARVSITATWNGSSWVGQLVNASNTDFKTKNSFSLAAGPSTVSGVAVGAPSGTFDGQLTFRSSGGTRGVSLVIASAKTLGDALAATLNSRVSLNAYLKYSNGQKEELKNVVWDREASTFSADGTVQTSAGLAVIRCKMSEMNVDNKDVLQCAMTTSKSNSPVANGPLGQRRAVVAPSYQLPPAPPTPAPTSAPGPVPTAVPMPGPTPSLIIKNMRAYEGTGVFTNDQGVQQTRQLTLTLTLPTELSGQVQKAKVKFIIAGSRVGAEFLDSTFNGGSGELSAKVLLTRGTLAGQLELSCGGMTFDNPRYDFMCHYESSVTNITGEFHFKAL